MNEKESRLTFRHKASEVCYQKQVRDRYSDEDEPPLPHKSVKKARVRPVSRDAAKQIILKYEWLGTLPSGTNRFYGIFFGPFCAGVTCFCIGGGGANSNAHKEWNIERDELAYLARGACVHWAPKNTNSKLISWSVRLVAEDGRSKLAIAYSDTDAGEIGTVYQASNWTYVGKGSETRQWVAPNGRVYDQRHPSNLRAKDGNKYPRIAYVKKLRDEGWTQQKSNPKYKYVKVLRDDPKLERLVRLKSKPYPKRDDTL